MTMRNAKPVAVLQFMEVEAEAPGGLTT